MNVCLEDTRRASEFFFHLPKLKFVCFLLIFSSGGIIFKFKMPAWKLLCDVVGTHQIHYNTTTGNYSPPQQNVGDNLGQYDPIDKSTMLSFGILVGLLTALVCVIIGIVVVLKIRTANNKKSNNKQRPGNLPILKEKISVPLSQSEEMYDEKNPDVVPSTEGKNKM